MFKPSNIEFQNDEISVARATLIAEGERLLSEVVLEQEGENILRRLEELDGLAEKFANQPASHSHKIVDEVKATVASFTREEAEKVAKALSIRELITTAISGANLCNQPAIYQSRRCSLSALSVKMDWEVIF